MIKNYFTNGTKFLFSTLAFLFISFTIQAQEIDSTQIWNDQIEQSFDYKTGIIDLQEGNAKLTVPVGFRYLNKEQSIYVLSVLWGNPADSSVLGMLVPENRSVLESNGWAYTIYFDPMGYVKDDDADDIDYDDLLKEQQKEFEDENPQRIKDGYQPIKFIGWASTPFYDKNKKVLHWAKELKFGDDSLSTLNYNLRVLGKKGIYMLNAIASLPEMNEVKASIDKVITSIEFNEGDKYANFNPDVDNVAAWTIGGLVAGKILAKIGFFAIILKFWKLIALGVAGAGAAIFKFFKKKKEDDDTTIS
jgi:uncharacterized membrane-anchored protein